MLNLPQSNPVIFRFQVKSFDPAQFMEEQESKVLIRLEIDEMKYGLLISNKSIEEAFEFSDRLRLIGKSTLDEILKLSLGRPSIVTIDKLSDKLVDFYLNLLSSNLLHTNLSTNYISFWRFIETQKEIGSSGIAVIESNESTLYAVFKTGALTGGWQAFEANTPSLELSSQRVLDISARSGGEFSYFKSWQCAISGMGKDMKTQRLNGFENIYNPGHSHHRKLLDEFGESGIELACQIVSGITLFEVAQISREPLLKVVEIAKKLVYLGVAVIL
jgi:hypothetical protein